MPSLGGFVNEKAFRGVFMWHRASSWVVFGSHNPPQDILSQTFLFAVIAKIIKILFSVIYALWLMLLMDALQEI